MPQLYYKTSSGTLVAIGTTAVTNDTTKVSLSGNESISGTKTFTGSVVLPASSATGKLTLAAGASGAASLNVPAGSAPTSPVDGDLWNTTTGLYYRNSTTTQHVPRVTVASTAPASPVDGDIWVDTSTPTWTSFTPGGSWVTFETTPTTYTPPGYMKDVNGFVHIRGLLKNGTTGTAIFTLPTGYRPTYQHSFVVQAGTGLARVDVLATGVVNVETYYSTGSSARLALDPIIFATF